MQNFTTTPSRNRVKDNVDICAPIFIDIQNSCLKREIFSSELKLADITPIINTVDTTVKKNIRTISILNSISKLFEKVIQHQLYPFFYKKLS